MQDDESLVGRSKTCPGFWLVYLYFKAWRACCSVQKHVTSYKLTSNPTPSILSCNDAFWYSTSRYVFQTKFRMWMELGTYLPNVSILSTSRFRH